MTAMRGYVGDLVFFFDHGKAVGLTLYREWISYAKELGVGEEISL